MSNPDEKAIERDFCAGELTIAEVAKKHEMSIKALRYFAERKKLKRAKVSRKNRGKNRGKNGAKVGQKTGAKTSDILPQKMPQNSALSTVKKSQKKSQEIPPADDENFTFNPDDFGLTGKEGRFVEAVAKGKKLIDAYTDAEYSDNLKTAYAQASKMVRKHKISRAIRWLRDRDQKRLALTEAEIIHQLSSIASADPNLISQIRRVNCRYCWGDNHQYQWRDVDEYERACASALAESKTPPSFDGGIGFVDNTVPNEDCPRCNGEGRMETFFADTSMLDGPERWLVTGVEETKVGLKVNMASPEAARKELMSYFKAAKGKGIVAGVSDGGAQEDDLDIEWKRLRNEKLQAEITRIMTGGNEGDMIIFHNSLPIPGAEQPEPPEPKQGE